MTVGYIGGWLSDKEDRLALQASSVPMLTSAVQGDLPPEMGVKDWMNIENQGSQGSCGGCARTYCLELGIKHQTGDIVQLSKQFAYITAQMEDGIVGDMGSTISGNARAALKGTCLEKWFPYTGRYTRKIPQEAYDHAKDYILNSHVTCRSYDDVFRFLGLGLGGVQIGIDWTVNDSAEPLQTYNSRGSGGGHSVSFLDWSPITDGDGRRFLRMFNSWGKGWGDNGTRLIAPRAIEQMLQHRNTVMIGFSDLKDLKPRRISWKGKGSIFNAARTNVANRMSVSGL